MLDSKRKKAMDAMAKLTQPQQDKVTNLVARRLALDKMKALASASQAKPKQK